ncbi:MULTISPECIES: hypothetical protein [Catenuloplanes]|uniref:Uncharacterized protein n=1 Tax=Catenuloplanes niger TaxID=587534 RepID=A0AAE4A002_9ACTN|nr:hypothetical protein [Catenuloplanes niger]MDR7326715.1 hypothetical protein [Catenuloplanes niger]
MTTVAGWIFEQNVVRFLEHLSHYVGHQYDAADEDALVGALDGTDDESDTGWFQYPLQGVPPVLVSLARAVGGSVVSVRIDGAIDSVLEARINTMLDLLWTAIEGCRPYFVRQNPRVASKSTVRRSAFVCAARAVAVVLCFVRAAVSGAPPRASALSVM